MSCLKCRAVLPTVAEFPYRTEITHCGGVAETKAEEAEFKIETQLRNMS